MIINERVKQVRLELGYTQIEFGKRIAVAQGYLANIEKGQRDVTEKILKLICGEFNVNEDWLRYGKGEMFINSDNFSLDEYAKKNRLTALELDIIKGYMQLDYDMRQNLVTYFKSIFDRHSETAATSEDSIEKELKNYRSELEAEQKGQILSVSELQKGKTG